MPSPATPRVLIADFPGLASNVDARDLGDGAAEKQLNACSIIAGELTVRLGVQEVTFEDD